jgi:hypothetical protein
MAEPFLARGHGDGTLAEFKATCFGNDCPGRYLLRGTIVYLCTMHPHMGILYYPWQYFASIAPPYWENFANTVSGNFHVAWIMCCTITVWLTETIWERYPFKVIKHDTTRRLVGFSVSLRLPGVSSCSSISLKAVVGARHPRNPYGFFSGLAMAPCWRDHGLLPPSRPVLDLLLWQLAQEVQHPCQLGDPNPHCHFGGMLVYWIYYNIGHLTLGTQGLRPARAVSDDSNDLAYQFNADQSLVHG